MTLLIEAGLDRSRFINRHGYVWAECTDKEYGEELIALVLMFGGHWMPNTVPAVGGNRRLYVPVHDDALPYWSRDMTEVVVIDYDKNKTHSVWVHIVHTDRFFKRLTTERKDYERWQENNTRIGRDDR